jgi:predicted RND superfamily exporter protein
VPENITVNGEQHPLGINVSYWTVINTPAFYIIQPFLINSFYAALSPEMLSFLVNDDFSKTLIYIFQPMMDISLTRQAVDGVNSAIDMKPVAGATVSHLTGVGAIELAVNDLLISGQLISLVVCTFATWLVLLAIFRSWKLALFTMIPCIVVVGLEPLVGLNIPLSIVTVMIGSIGIGTGVDFSIQLSQRIRTGGLNIDSIKTSVENLGISFVEATTVTVFAFMAVLLSPSALVTYSLGSTPTNWFTMGVPIDSVRQFVIMIQVLFCLNALAAMFILPAIYTVWLRFRESEKKRKEKEGW